MLWPLEGDVGLPPVEEGPLHVGVLLAAGAGAAEGTEAGEGGGGVARGGGGGGGVAAAAAVAAGAGVTGGFMVFFEFYLAQCMFICTFGPSQIYC